MTRFGTVLVANRGEIARRVISAARTAGLRSVAVYSDADRDAQHVREADAAVRIGPPPAAESYLSIPALLAAAARSGADAIHPGYGFLSERAEFARAVTDAGLAFIGPPADVIELMGRKDRARKVAAAAGVPVVPASETQDADRLGEIAEQVGFPLLVKAAAGGGGKGMRVIRAAAELADATAAARRESAAAFGDDTLLFERYLQHGRHIEVQVIADEHGHVLHLLERDCSVQRRHQKVVEEAPASVISSQVRELVRSSAVALAREVGYLNAGTVEFLVSGEEAYFLEMNTRLQVEHPVTELVTGLDLVLLQFLVAQGEPLPIRQEDVVGTGHAIEVRVYAEDPYHGYLPQAGVAEVVQWPTGVRVDAALVAGQRVSTFYDPMLGKVVASGATREAARRVLVSALDDTAILGLTTNLGFLRDLADSEQFRRSEIDTSWLDNNPHSFTLRAPDAAWCLAAWSLASAAQGDHRDPLGVGDGWRLGADPAVVSVELTGADGEARRLQVDLAGGAMTGPHASRAVRSLGTADGRVLLEIDGAAQAGRLLVRSDEVVVSYRGQTYRFSRPDVFGRRVHARVQDGSVTAPMPGTVLGVSVAVGEDVGEGQPLGVLEAMKMEITLAAPFAGTVTEVGAEVGAQVDLGARLFVVTPARAADLAPGGQDTSPEPREAQ